MPSILDKSAVKLWMKRLGATKTKDMDEDAAKLVRIAQKLYEYLLSIGDKKTAQIARTTKVEIKNIYNKYKKSIGDKILQYDLPETSIHDAPQSGQLITQKQYQGIISKDVSECFTKMINLIIGLIQTVRTQTENMVKIFNMAYKISCELSGKDTSTTDLTLPNISAYDPANASLKKISGLLSQDIHLEKF